MMSLAKRSRGFSLIEILVVVAIIGVMSMVGVPAFINYQRAGKFKTSMRQYVTDLRKARQRAVTTNSYMRVGNLRNEGSAVEEHGVYEVLSSSDRGATFTLLETRRMEKRSVFDTTNDVTFMPNGTARLPVGTFQVENDLKCQDTVAKPDYRVTVSVTGKISVN